MKILDLILKHGVVTKPYPFAPYEVGKNFRGKPEYEYSLCIGCAACGIACPSNAISVNYDTQKSILWRYDTGRCIFCGRCEEVCPTKAIKLGKEFELGVNFERLDLITEGKLETQNCLVCSKPFASKRFVDFVLRKIDLSNLSTKRKSNAKYYVQICPSCKQNSNANAMCDKDYQKVE